MKMTIKVILRPSEASNRLLKLLQDNQFEIWLHNPVTNEYFSYSKKTRQFHDGDYRLVAIYNDNATWPSQELFKTIDSHLSVLHYTIDKRVD